MDYSDRVNSKKGAGAVADKHESNVHTKRRIKELLTTQVLDLDKDPYVFRNHLGVLECRLCLTTHTNEASYISHLGGKKHGLNLERRRILDEKYNKVPEQNIGVSMTNVEKRHWKKLGRPIVKITKVRLPQLLQMGMLVQARFPQITVKEPYFRFMSYYEMSQKNQASSKSYLLKEKTDYEETDDVDPSLWQYLVLSAEPYENVAICFPSHKQLDTPPADEMSQNYWWHWDSDSKEFFLQVLFKEAKSKAD